MGKVKVYARQDQTRKPRTTPSQARPREQTYPAEPNSARLTIAVLLSLAGAFSCLAAIHNSEPGGHILGGFLFFVASFFVYLYLRTLRPLPRSEVRRRALTGAITAPFVHEPHEREIRDGNVTAGTLMSIAGLVSGDWDDMAIGQAWSADAKASYAMRTGYSDANPAPTTLQQILLVLTQLRTNVLERQPCVSPENEGKFYAREIRDIRAKGDMLFGTIDLQYKVFPFEFQVIFDRDLGLWRVME